MVHWRAKYNLVYYIFCMYSYLWWFWYQIRSQSKNICFWWVTINYFHIILYDDKSSAIDTVCLYMFAFAINENCTSNWLNVVHYIYICSSVKILCPCWSRKLIHTCCIWLGRIFLVIRTTPCVVGANFQACLQVYAPICCACVGPVNSFRAVHQAEY